MKAIQTIKTITLNLLVLTFIFSSCTNNKEEIDLVLPTISEIEIGLHNNEIGVIGEDFHFNAEVLAGDLLENVTINIVQKSDIEYSEEWTYEIIFTERITDLKNATLHRHFDIPADAPKGMYDIVITVNDQNGTSLEEVRNIDLIDANDFPEVTPWVSVFSVDKINEDNPSGGWNNFYNNGEFRNEEEAFFNKDESIWSSFQIGDVKGNGIMYGLLIKKSYNHLPENIEEIDFSKVIVTEVVEHFDEEEIFILKNNKDTGHWNYGVPLQIGATEDNLTPTANAIIDGRAWETGTYYYGVVYTNLSYNRSTFKYIEFDIIME
ncbi:DUF4625 domain-containing protein [Polaribacter sargassicola]|uniref:DUF4625 domain-containing protein n=1 Tax=Polaribacter sargassicola TaxID=2836891 RepID=UPI001F294FDF|nr:DUF4625 domain-containing protein [Polaribacter sp. DS7-9]MCG1036811.1 DUF4625 domain-containing protein [Polaribacter sp. DS7-9]